jgi:hypothetical protein
MVIFHRSDRRSARISWAKSSLVGTLTFIGGTLFVARRNQAALNNHYSTTNVDYL